ncbi:hypothetical protein [Paenibacillus odorifer]|uniref:hypothetical protein n=1 Tax=Paenibacillus odorifer TaxID=189426 RepID=UPI00096D27CF|nr:hypothetical protein [Paenibacillus odorifer]OMD76832.1 hypothetical protein BSK50_13855 [Paenibacillus odorifer]
MDWDKLKERSDIKATKNDLLDDLKKEYEVLSIENFRKWGELEEANKEAKKVLELRAFKDFKKFFEEKKFAITENNSLIMAVYNDIKFELKFNENFFYSIHFYADGEYKDNRKFCIDLDKIWNEEYVTVRVDKPTDNYSIQEFQLNITKLKQNNDTVDALLSIQNSLTFSYVLEENYGFLVDDQFENIEVLLNSFKN